MAMLVAAVSACGPGEGRHVEGGAENVVQGAQAAARWVAEGRTGGPLRDEEIIALGYLERLRLGLGSPFRLTEYALNDPRLSPEARRRLGEALLSRTAAGDAFRIDPRSLDGVSLAGQPADGRPGLYHLQLIGGAVEEARDPRAGELAVRLAYSLAAAERTIPRHGVRLGAQVAALLRDREIARDDARALLRAARASGIPALDLLPRWRAERRFQVETPTIQAPSAAIEREALELAPILAASLRDQGPRLKPGLYPLPPTAIPLLRLPDAYRLATLADSLDYPPQTPISVAVSVHRRELTEARGLSDGQRQARERLVERATSEEKLAAEHTLVVRRGPRDDAAPGRTALWAAVSLRPYGQEAVWLPGFEGPTTGELVDRYGLAGLEFDEDVRPAWRPYYRRMLAGSLQDLQRVIPSLNLRGLRVKIGRSPARAGTLALHDPKTRTVYLPAGTGAGTIAHEVAHDLDWQVSLRRYRVRGDYGTDRAVRRSSDRLAASLQGLSSATLLPPQPGESQPALHARRPAEVFARNMDWFVAVSLAADGRQNGYLSSVQDDLLTGFGTVLPPDISGSAGAALIAILDEVAPVYSSTRDWFLSQYGPARIFTPYDLLRQVLEGSGSAPEPMRAPEDERAPEPATSMSPPVQRFAAVRAARDSALTAIDAWVCRAPGAAYDRRLERARVELVEEAAAARSRGIALERASALGGEHGRRWMARRLYGAVWDVEPVEESLRAELEALLEQVRAFEARQLRMERPGFRLSSPSEDCHAGPLALTAGR